MLETLIVVVHLLVSIALVGLVLIQQGKGADAGASFGAGASGTIFGSQGTGSFFSRLTAILAAVFFASSLALAFYAKERSKGHDDMGLPSMHMQQAFEVETVPPVQGDIPQLEEAGSAEVEPPVLDAASGDVPQAD